jgi:hypothetical protein
MGLDFTILAQKEHWEKNFGNVFLSMLFGFCCGMKVIRRVNKADPVFFSFSFSWIRPTNLTTSWWAHQKHRKALQLFLLDCLWQHYKRKLLRKLEIQKRLWWLLHYKDQLWRIQVQTHILFFTMHTKVGFWGLKNLRSWTLQLPLWIVFLSYPKKRFIFPPKFPFTLSKQNQTSPKAIIGWKVAIGFPEGYFSSWLCV